LLADNDSSQRAAGGSGIRLRLLRKPANGFRYGLALSQFSGGFHPYDSIVVAGASEESLPFMDGQRIESHYRVSGNHDIGLGLLCYVACRPTRSFAAILKPLSGGKIIRQQRLVMT
jgi:hypothetical protein